jgi:hypothetical protein
MIQNATKAIQEASIDDINDAVRQLSFIIESRGLHNRSERAKARGFRNDLIRQLGVRRDHRERS